MHILALLLVFLVGCSSQAKQKVETKTARINIVEPHSLDPRKVQDLADIALMKMLFEGLTRQTPENKTELSLARAVHFSPDHLTYTFTLRPSKWSNGDPVTAHDFVYAWKKVLSPTFASSMAMQLYPIKNGKEAKEGKVSVDEIGVAALDDYTLEVKLAHATPYFLDLLSMPIFFPVNSKLDQQEPRWHERVETYVGNGPFTLKEWRHRDLIRVAKNGDYWDAPAVKLDGIELTMVEDKVELEMYEKGGLDWAGSPLSILPLDALGQLKKEKKLHIAPFLATQFVRVNTTHAVLKHPLFRKALAIAADRKALVDHVLQGSQIPATGLVPTSFELRPTPYFADGNSVEARALFDQVLEETGLTREEIPMLTLTYRENERARHVSEVLQEQWRKTLGINVQLQSLEKKVYFDAVSKNNFELVLASWVADFADPINFLEIFKYKNSSSNHTGWEDPLYTTLLDDSSAAAEPNKRKELLASSEAVLIDQMPLIPLYHYTMLYVCNPTLKNVSISPLGSVDFKWAYIEGAR